MKDITSESYKKPMDDEMGFEETCYSYHHLIFVTKKRYKLFKNPHTREVCQKAFKEIEERYGFKIKVGVFSEEGNHWHGEVDVPSKFSIMQTTQIFKSHSASKIFEEIPNLRKRYPKGSLWSGWKHYGSVGPMKEEVVQKYIVKQDIEQKKMTDFFS